MSQKQDIVFSILQQMHDHSPKASFKRLNPALHDTLRNCISSDIPFQPDTFHRIFYQLKGPYWFGEAANSHIGEEFYSHACDNDHASAIQSFETFAGRPGVLWEENIQSPKRLHLGSQFTWQGHYVTVTSLQTDRLVAYAYKNTELAYGIKVGAFIGYSPERIITSIRNLGKTTVLHMRPAPETTGKSTILRRFIITYDEIAEFRRSENKRVAAILAEIDLLDPRDPKVIKRLSAAVSKEHFRRFQLEKINASFTARKQALEKKEAAEKVESERAEQKRQRETWLAEKPRYIAAWRAGSNGAYLPADEILMRIKGDLVECSNGNSISVAAARIACIIVMDQRNADVNVSVPLEGYTINHIGPKGVEIGCTLVPWPEIEAIASLLK